MPGLAPVIAGQVSSSRVVLRKSNRLARPNRGILAGVPGNPRGGVPMRGDALAVIPRHPRENGEKAGILSGNPRWSLDAR